MLTGLVKNMHSKISLKWSFLFVAILGVAFSFVIIFLLLHKLPVDGSSEKLATSLNRQTSQNINSKTEKAAQNISSVEQTSFGLPLHIKIPKIKVDAGIEYVGLTSAGAVDVPKGPVKVAWYDLGPRPGEKGNAIIVGHFGWKNGISAVFDNLSQLRKGDKIFIDDDNGLTTSFVVKQIKKYNEKADAVDVFISKDGKAHLNLITCVGIWNKRSKSYNERLVIFADKE